MIYFLQPTDGGPIKIGFSADVDTRHKALEAHYRRPLALLATLPGGRTEEAEIHRRFDHLRLDNGGSRGARIEQFRPAADLLAFIGRPLLVDANPDAVEAMPGNERIIIINLKGTEAQSAWLEGVHRKTYLPKSVVVRLALTLWAEKNGHVPFPTSEDAD